MYSELFTSGDSFFTEAWDNSEHEYGLTRPNYRKNHRVVLDKPVKYSFPQLLANNLKIPLINHAKHGHSNSYIIRTAYNYIHSTRTNNKKSLVVLGLTDFARNELHLPLSKMYHPFSSSDYNYGQFDNNKTIIKYVDKTKLTEYLDYYYKYFWSENLTLNELIQDLNMLHSYAKYSGCRLIILQSFHRSKNDNLVHNLLLKNSSNSFEMFNFGFPDHSFYSWSDFIRLYAPEHFNSHPLFYDTNILANYVAEYIKTGKLPQLTLDVSKYTANFKINLI